MGGADERPFAWVQLTAADNDPVHLGRHIALALDTVAPVARAAPRPPPRGRPVRRPRHLPHVGSHARGASAARARARRPPPPHGGASDPRGRGALHRRGPAGSQIAIAGRHLPVHMGRHHMRGHVLDVGVDDLAMDATEAQLLFERAGLELTETRSPTSSNEPRDGRAACTSRPSCSARPTRRTRSPGGTGSSASTSSRRCSTSTSAEMVEFLERSATFEYMDAELLDAFLERSDGGAMLAAIESSGNMFLVPLDNEGRRYRYHHLFRELLRQRLRTNDPALAQRLDSRASVMLERAGDVDGAIRHAVNAHEEERAANLILGATFARFFDGRYAQIGEWLALLGDEAVDRYPAAAVATAWYGVACGDHERIAQACLAAERFGWYGPLADGSPSLPVALATMRIFLAADGVTGVIRDAEIVREAGGPAWNSWWGFATGAQGTAYSMLGELELARQRITEAMAARPVRRSSRRPVPLTSRCWRCTTVISPKRSGSPTRARRIADHHHLDGFVPTLAVYAIAALVAARTRRPDEARSAAAVARALIVRLGDASPRTLVFGLLLLAQTALALGDRAEARGSCGKRNGPVAGTRPPPS